MPDIETKRAPHQEMPKHHEVGGVDVLVEPGVLPPGFGARLLAAHIHVSPGQRFLDLQTGPGTLAIIAGMRWASGLAVDKDSEAVRNAQENFHRHNVRARAIQGDLFVNVPKGEKFDQIYAVIPSSGERARRFIDDLLAGARSRLNPHGKLLFTMSLGVGTDSVRIATLKNGFKIQTVARFDSPKRGLLYELSHGTPKLTDVA